MKRVVCDTVYFIVYLGDVMPTFRKLQPDEHTSHVRGRRNGDRSDLFPFLIGVFIE